MDASTMPRRDGARQDITEAVAAAVAIWGAPALFAGGAGWYLRSLDQRRRAAVVAAQQAQRLHLARDLHDFVAHDISEMLAQSQGEQVLAADHPQLASTFRTIEEAAQRALRSMDRSVRTLHAAGLPGGDGTGAGAGGGTGHPGEARDAAPPTLVDLPVLTRRFADTSGVAVELDLDGALTPDGLRDLPVEASATLYRVAVEALTNVRRHAPSARLVTVELRSRTDPDDGRAPILELSVSDDAERSGDVRPGAADRPGGLGLVGLAARVERLGGTLSAGPRSPAGWVVSAAVAVDAGGRTPRRGPA